jgi:hypothetical protein
MIYSLVFYLLFVLIGGFGVDFGGGIGEKR